MKKSILLKKLGVYKSVTSLGVDQTQINFENGKILQSYNSLVGVVYDGTVFVGKDYDYSKTTSKYLNLFCGMTAKECSINIDKGIVKEII